MSESTEKSFNTSLGQNLAVQTQVHLSGTVGRLLKQIRDVEEVSQQFQQIGMVRPIERPQPLDARVSGIATQHKVGKILGGFLYVAGAVCFDLEAVKNAIRTVGQTSVCRIDDIDSDQQPKRMQFIAINQAYEMLESVFQSSYSCDLVILDTPLLMDLSYRPHEKTPKDSGYFRDYQQATSRIEAFWKTHREKIYPWNPKGPIICSIQPSFSGLVKFVFQEGLKEQSFKDLFHPSEAISEEAVRVVLAYWTKGLVNLPDQQRLESIIREGFSHGPERINGAGRVEFLVWQFLLRENRSGNWQLVDLLDRGGNI